jgi:hypothetical protein
VEGGSERMKGAHRVLVGNTPTNSGCMNGPQNYHIQLYFRNVARLIDNPNNPNETIYIFTTSNFTEKIILPHPILLKKKIVSNLDGTSSSYE